MPRREPVPRVAHGEHGGSLREREADLRQQLAARRAAAIQEALRHHGGNHTKAAACLGLQRTWLLRLMKELGLRGEGDIAHR